MNSTDSKPPAPMVEQGGSEPDVICIALTSLPDTWTIFGERLWQAVLRRELRRAGVNAVCYGGILLRPLQVRLELIETRERNATSRVVLTLLKDLDLIPFCEVAYLDLSEGYWRKVQSFSDEPFERFLKPDQLKDAIAEGKRECESWLKVFRRPSSGCEPIS